MQLFFSSSFFFLLLLFLPTSQQDPTTSILLSFKSSLLSHPLTSWDNTLNPSPCSWLGITCSNPNTTDPPRVTSLSLPSLNLTGPLPPALFLLPDLTHLNLSRNSLHGSLPTNLSTSLLHLDLSSNSLSATVPPRLALLPNLTFLSLADNHLSGDLPRGFAVASSLDFSRNLLNGSLPPGPFGGAGTTYLNLSHNRFAGEIPPAFAAGFPANATIDLSFNGLVGALPNSSAMAAQRPEAFAGNVGLCGRPLRAVCSAPARPAKSPPALAVLPSTIDGSVSNFTDRDRRARSGLRPAVVAGIVFGDLVGVALVSFFVVYGYGKWRGKGPLERKEKGEGARSSSSSSGSDGESEVEVEGERGGMLVTVDGETKLEVETLLKASAYILGATGSSIVYKAVLGDGTSYAVRRLGDGGGKLREFEGQVKNIAKLRHPNLVRICGFYWGAEEKLLITEYVPNGSLAHLHYKKAGSSPYHLPWDACLVIARGIARALTYLHDKKVIHGRLKPSNILLHHDFHPKLSDLGLDRLTSPSLKQHASLRHLSTSSKRSTLSHSSSQQELSPSPYSASPYHAPESFKNLKPSTKWDVYSFGVVLLEMLTGRVFGEAEVAEWSGMVWGTEDEKRAVRLVDVGLRREMEGREEALIGWFRLGLNCAAAQPGRRPTIREVSQVLERFPWLGSLT